MIRINLLPHRAEKRKRRQIQFISLCVVSAILAGVLVGLGYGFMSARIFYQDKRNEYLKQEIAKLEKQIAELEGLRAEIKKLLARKDEVEKLQSSRSDVVHLMDQMLHILPPGIHLRTLRQDSKAGGTAGSKISISGVAQSDARVSTLMRAIEASRWLDTPVLIDVHAAASGKDRVNEFSMTFNLKKGSDTSATVAASAPAAASAPLAASAPAAALAPVVAPAPAPAVASAPAVPGKK